MYNKICLVSGGTGFLGENLVCHLLNLNYKVYALIRENSEKKVINKNLTYIQLNENWELGLKNKNIDYIYHIASYVGGEDCGFTEIDKIVDANIKLGLKLLEISKFQGNDKKSLFIHCLSYWQFRLGNEIYKPNSLYAASKQAFMTLVEHYRINEGIKSTGLVLFDIYGECDKRKKLINILVDYIKKKKRNKNINSLKMTSGLQEIEFIHVDDVINGIFETTKLLESGKINKEYYCLRSRGNSQLKEIINEVIEELKLPSDIILWGGLEEKENQVKKLIASNILPGWNPKKNFVNEIMKMVNNDGY